MGSLRRLFCCKEMLRKEQIIGDIPSDETIYRRTFQIAWPSMMESVLISLIGAVDLIMVGGIGADAIAAVGICNQPKFIILAVIMSLNVGVTVIVSRRKGQKDTDSANRCLRQSILLTAGTSFLLSLVGFFFARDILILAGALPGYVDLAVIYFQILMVGNFFNCISMTINAAQRGCGNTKISMRTNLAANGLNLFFNYLLINGIGIFPQMGVAGAALATSIGNVAACIMSICSVFHKGEFLYIQRNQDWRFDRRTLSDLYRISSSAFVEQVFMRIGFFTYAKTVAALGMIEFATHQVCMNIMTISFSVGDGLSIATSSLVGQSLGERRSDMAILYSKATRRIGMLLGFLLGVFMCIFRVPIIALFSDEGAIIQMGSQIMFVIAVTMMFQITQVITFGSLRGAGDVKYTALISLISVTVIRPILTWLFCFPFAWGLMGAWISLFLDQLIRYALSHLRFHKGEWVYIQV